MSILQMSPPSEALLAAVRAVARQQLGSDDLAGAALGQAVQRVSEAYRRQQGSPLDLQSDRAALCARLKFFLPRDWPKIELPLAELASVAALPTPSLVRVLDLGAGLGATGLGAAAFLLGQPGVERVRIDAVDCDASALRIAAKLAEHIARDQGLAIELVTRCARLGPSVIAEVAPPYHLIVLGFVLNELWEQSAEAAQQHASWLVRLSELLTDDGALVVLEPALRVNSRALQRVRGVLTAAAGPPYVFAPCLHREACPLLERERDWCHEQLPLALPAELAAIARAAGLRTAELTFSYLTLHRARRSLAELDPNAQLLRVVSSPLRSKGKLELAVCASGPTRKLRRLDRHASQCNLELESSGRGSILRVTEVSGEQPAVRRVEAESAISALQSPRATDAQRGLC